jgi:hypothetical protein
MIEHRNRPNVAAVLVAQHLDELKTTMAERSDNMRVDRPF